MAISSINFEKAKSHSQAHNTRKEEPSYLLPQELRLGNEYWDCGQSDEEVFLAELKKTERKGGPKPILANSRWEAALNLNEEHTLEDVQRVARHIEEKFKIKCTAIAVHRDEGSIGRDGKVKYNLHAHLNFVTFKDGKQNWRLTQTKSKLPQLQTDVANMLNMQRGDPTRKAPRLSAREYKKHAKIQETNEIQIQNLTERLRLEQLEHEKTLQKLLEAQKEALEHQNLAQSLKIENRALSVQNRALKAELEMLKAMYNEDREKLKASGQATQKDYQELKKAHDELKAELRIYKFNLALEELNEMNSKTPKTTTQSPK